MRTPSLGWISLAAACALAIGARPEPAAGVQAVTDGRELPVVEHVLGNGMRFLLLPRPGAPTVAFVTHIAVGSVHDPPGATGTSHLLEHLLFKGTTTIGTRDVGGERALFAIMDAAEDSLASLPSRGAGPDTGTDAGAAARFEARIRALEDSARTLTVPGEFDEIFSRNGARGLNATTGYEATEYTVSLPANRAKLWFVLEADRMRNAVFREFYSERNVVAEERRARVESSPGGTLSEAHLGEAFRTHPYGVLPIGRMDEILSLRRSAVREHFERYYGPGNTTVAIVGAFESDSAVAWAEAYFGPLEPGDPAPQSSAVEPAQTEARMVEVAFDADPVVRVSWRVPGATHPDAPALAMLANVLVGSRDSRLYRRLVRDDRSVRSVVAATEPGGRDPGLFTIQADPIAPETPEAVLDVILEELARLRREPPSEVEIERVRARLEAASVRRLTSNEGLALQLVASQALWGDWRETFGLQERMRAVDAGDIVAVLDRYFRDEGRTVGILRRAADVPECAGARSPMIAPLGLAVAALLQVGAPTPAAPTTGGSQDLPVGRLAVEALEFPPLVFEPPVVDEHEVSGVLVFHLYDATVPLVDVQIQIQGGIGHFPRDALGPLSALPNMLRNGGTRRAPPDSVDRALDLLAAQLTIGAGAGGTSVGLNVLEDRLEPALALLSEILLEPGFSDDALEVWRGQEAARIRGREDDAGSLAFSEFNRLMYPDHPVGWVIEEAEISPDRVSVAGLRDLHADLFCRDRLVLGVSGDVAWEEAELLLAEFIAPWPECDTSLPTPTGAQVRSEGGVFVLPRPVDQSTIIAAGPSRIRLGDTPEFFASRVADFVLGGGGFSSRILSRLRTDEGLAYGAGSVWTAPILYDGIVGGLTASGASTTVRAAELLLEVLGEVRAVPPTQAEVDEAVETTSTGYVFAFDSPAQIVARQMSYRLQRLPSSWLFRYLEGLQAVTPDQVAEVVAEEIDIARMTVLIVGDAERFGPGLEALGPVYRLSPDGTYVPWVRAASGPGGSPQSLP